MLITELPFGLAGKVFASPMPFGLYDNEGEALKEFRENRVSVIVLLVEDVECLQKAKRNLYDLYLEQGFRVIHLPIADFSIPSAQELMHAVNETIESAKGGRTVAIHCSGGIGEQARLLLVWRKSYLTCRVIKPSHGSGDTSGVQ